VNNYKSREIEILKETEEIKKQIETEQKMEKDLKEEIFALQKIIRSLPYEQQIYLKRLNTVKK
jgi:hypothetical protein